MPEIGDQLRETRMRNRIDITEVEAATKIRAKYLRALENEEWDLLPGPTFVKTFLRTYADYLGLDARNLVEEYRSRYERSSGPGADAVRGQPRQPPRSGLAPVRPDAVAADRARPDPARRRAVRDRHPGAATTIPADEVSATPDAGGDPRARRRRAEEAEGEGQAGKQEQAAPKVVRLQIQPTGPVSVCVEDASGDPVVDNVTLEANQDTETFRSKRFTMSFGTGDAVMRVDGKAYQVSDDAPVGYSVKAGGKPRRVSERPTCG